MKALYKFLVVLSCGAAVFILLLIYALIQSPPIISATVSYPSLVFRPSEFDIQFSLHNTVAGSLVKNSISINSGKITQLDNIPSDCEELTKNERICEESLSFRVDNQTSIGANKIVFDISSSSRFDFFMLKNFIEFSKVSSTLEIPVNVQTPEVERLTAQTNLNHSRNNMWYLIAIFFLISSVFSILMTVAIFVPEIWELIKGLF